MRFSLVKPYIVLSARSFTLFSRQHQKQQIQKAPLANGPLKAPPHRTAKKSQDLLDLKKKEASRNTNRLYTYSGIILAFTTVAILYYAIAPRLGIRRHESINHTQYQNDVNRARNLYRTGLTDDEYTKLKVKESQDQQNQIGLLAWQKRREDLTCETQVENGIAETEAVVDSDPRSLAEIKSAISAKAANTETWRRIQKEIEEGKER